MISTILGWVRDLRILISRTVVTDTYTLAECRRVMEQTYSVSGIVRDELF